MAPVTSSFNLLVTGGLLVAVLVAAALLAAGARRRPAWLLAGLSLHALLLDRAGNSQSLASVGGLNVLVSDPVLLVAVFATVPGLTAVRQRLQGLRIPLLLLLALVAVQLLFGFARFGNTALLQARGLLLLVGIAAFVLSLDLDDRALGALVRRWMHATALALCVLAAYRASTSGIGDANTVVITPDGEYLTTRVVVSQQAALIAASAVLTLSETTRRLNGLVALRTLLLFSAVLVAQHRSVWAATAVASVVLLARAVPGRRVVQAAGVAALSVVLLVAASSYSGGSVLSRALNSSVSTASTTSGTGGARINENTQLVARALAAGPTTLVMGEPFGAPFIRFEQGRAVTYSPHNAYVESFLRLGLVGLGLVLTVLAGALRRTWSTRSGWLGVVVLFATYSTAYGFPAILGPVLAAALVLFARQSATPGADLRSEGASELDGRRAQPSVRSVLPLRSPAAAART